MIKFENVEVMGWEHAIRGMRNPKNSWDKSDTNYDFESCQGCPHEEQDCRLAQCIVIGPNDLKLMKALRDAGTDHRKYLRMITVYVDITAPLYWWKEFDTYAVGVVKNSCSTMHKIHAKEFTLEDFSCEHLSKDSLQLLEQTIDKLNVCRDQFNMTKLLAVNKKWWWQMIQLLPSSYNQKRTVMLNYEVLANIYKPTSRRHHKLDEWNVDCPGSFCDWIKTLPYSELITGEEKGE